MGRDGDFFPLRNSLVLCIPRVARSLVVSSLINRRDSLLIVHLAFGILCVAAMASCMSRRARIVIAAVVLLAYAMAVIVFGVHQVYSTAVGWLTAALVVACYLRFVMMPAETAPFSMFVTRPVVLLFGAASIGSFASALYFLILAVRNREALSMDSSYLTFIAFTMASKWSLYVTIATRRARREGALALAKPLMGEGQDIINDTVKEAV